jgi:hypothetical protein
MCCIPVLTGCIHLVLFSMLQGSALELLTTKQIRQIDNSSSTGLEELADIVEQWGSTFNYIHTSAAFAKAANLRRAQPAAAVSLLHRLAGIWAQVLTDSDAQGMANVLWACSKLSYTSAQLWSST